MTNEDPTQSVPTTPPPQAVPPPSYPPTPSPPPTPPPAWRPPPADHGRSVSLILGIIILAIGGWFFATRTLGLDLPRIDWAQFWPLILIGLGLWIVYRSMQRRT